MSTEYIDISACPKCKGTHRYKLDVDRAIVLKMLTMDEMRDRSRSVRFTRLFICPVKKEKFQGRFVLSDTSSDRIANLTVMGIVINDDTE